MADGVTLLIGPQALAAFVSRYPGTEGTDFLVFPEDRVCEAVEQIVLRRPRVVVLPEKFASSPRGTALAHRIAIDTGLKGTQVVVVDGAGAAAPLSIDGRPTWLPPDASGTRRVPRIRIRKGIDVQVDGGAAMLVDLSTLGAQVISTTVLKPRQRVRVVFPLTSYTIRAVGTVAWALYESPKGGVPPQYRAGLEFSSADPEPLLQFCLEQAAEAPAI
jgi:hypothetical protein